MSIIIEIINRNVYELTESHRKINCLHDQWAINMI